MSALCFLDEKGVKRYEAHVRFLFVFLHLVVWLCTVCRQIRFEAGCPDPLSYGRVKDIITSTLFTG
jgi:hypothetical protein